MIGLDMIRLVMIVLEVIGLDIIWLEMIGLDVIGLDLIGLEMIAGWKWLAPSKNTPVCDIDHFGKLYSIKSVSNTPTFIPYTSKTSLKLNKQYKIKSPCNKTVYTPLILTQVSIK